MRLRLAISAIAVLVATTNAVPSRRANELTLAGLRPGRDVARTALQLYKKPNLRSQNEESEMDWESSCQKQTLAVETDSSHKIQTIRATEADWVIGNCVPEAPRPWRTGRGLRVWDSADRVNKLYGEPDSRSPSTKDGQRLELLYYAFDWAGPDVPQVMEVLCTVEKDGKPGRVVEITLAASSL